MFADSNPNSDPTASDSQSSSTAHHSTDPFSREEGGSPEHVEGTPLPPEMGPSENDWDLYRSYDLTDIQFRAIELTIEGYSDVHIADMLSINRRTLWKWKTLNEDYRLALADARVQVHATVADRYRRLLLRATSVMAKFLEDPAENNRFRASYALLMMAGCFKPLPPMLPAQGQTLTFPPPELPPKVG
jgi:hypothetical protein